MTTSHRPGIAVAVVLALVLGAAVSVLSVARARAQDAAPAVTACGLSQHIMQQSSGGVVVISRPNAFDTSGQQLCISGSTSSPGFTITNNLRYTGAWQAYPFTGYGCAYNECSSHSALPMQVRSLPANTNTSFSWKGAAAPGNWNASYDIWLDTRDQTTAQDDGAELMIWLRPNPGYHGGAIVHIAKRRYWFQHWRACNGSICWNYVQFRFTHTVHGVQRLWLMPFLRYMEQQGLARPSWWLTSIHAGYEMVSGGKGLTTTWFNAHV